MDLLESIEQYRVLACRSCAFGIVPEYLISYIWKHHRHYGHEFRTWAMVERCVKDQLMPTLSQELLDPQVASPVLPPAGADPLLVLQVHSGFECTYCGYISRSENTIRQHYNVQHATVRRHRGGNRATATGLLLERLDREHYGDRRPWTPIFSQRFFAANQRGPAARCFRASAPSVAEGSKKADDAAERQIVLQDAYLYYRASTMANDFFSATCSPRVHARAA